MLRGPGVDVSSERQGSLVIIPPNCLVGGWVRVVACAGYKSLASVSEQGKTGIELTNIPDP